MLKWLGVITGIVFLISIVFLARRPEKLDADGLDPQAALIEVLPSASIQQSPAAVELTDRLVHKQVLLLEHPTLITQVLQNPDIHKAKFVQKNPGNAVRRITDALRVRVIPQTNIIEISLDPKAAGDDAPTIAEAIVNQRIENEKLIKQNVTLTRSVALNNMKNRYQFRKDELSRDLREKTLQLSVDGMGTPGRMSAREVELNQLLQQKADMQRKVDEAASPQDKEKAEVLLKALLEKLDAAKMDMGTLTNAMAQYLVLKDDEATTRALLKKVNEELDQISQAGDDVERLEIRWLCRPRR